MISAALDGQETQARGEMLYPEVPPLLVPLPPAVY